MPKYLVKTSGLFGLKGAEHVIELEAPTPKRAAMKARDHFNLKYKPIAIDVRARHKDGGHVDHIVRFIATGDKHQRLRSSRR